MTAPVIDSASSSPVTLAVVVAAVMAGAPFTSVTLTVWSTAWPDGSFAVTTNESEPEALIASVSVYLKAPVLASTVAEPFVPCVLIV